MLDIFLRKFGKYRKAIGLAYFYFGPAITYFLRDGIGLAPGNTLFTGVFTLTPFLLVMPTNLFKTYYQPNKIAYVLSFCFLFTSFLYFVFFRPNPWFTNVPHVLIDYGIMFTVFMLLVTISTHELVDTFAPICLMVGLLGCIFLIYYVLRNPAYVIGMRAAIEVGTEGNTTSNPHIYARSAFAGIFSTLVLLKNETVSLKRILLIVAGFFCLITLFLTQSMSSILAFGLGITLYIHFNSSISSIILKGYQLLWNWRFLVVVLGISIGIFNVWGKYKGQITNLSEIITGRLGRITALVVGSEQKKMDIDLSAAARVDNIAVVKKTIQNSFETGDWFSLIFGNGYDKLYIDSPIIESYFSFGVLGFLLYVSALLMFLKLVLMEMKNPRNDLTMLISYLFLLGFVQNFTSGSSVDYLRWTVFALISRFFISRTNKSKSLFIQTPTYSNSIKSKS